MTTKTFNRRKRTDPATFDSINLYESSASDRKRIAARTDATPQDEDDENDDLSAAYPTDRRHHVALSGARGERLDRALAAALPELSRTRLKALILSGCVSSAGRTIGDPGHRVKPEQSFDIIVPQALPISVEPQAMDLHVVFEDSDILVIDKPAGLVVHPGAGQPNGTLVNALLYHCGDRLSGIGGALRPGIVHRLDKDTSGLMVVAKSDAAHQGLCTQFADRSLSRTYWAIVRGAPKIAKGTLDWPIGRDSGDRKRMATVRHGGKPALTFYNRLRGFGRSAALLECRIGTGRTHQIRVHLAALGHPIVGDPLYGRQVRYSDAASAALRQFQRQALHAKHLKLRHPLTDEVMSFESDVPEDIAGLITELARLEKPCSES